MRKAYKGDHIGKVCKRVQIIGKSKYLTKGQLSKKISVKLQSFSYPSV